MKQCKTCIHKEVCPKVSHIENYRSAGCEHYEVQREKARYNIYYRKYSILARAYIPYIKVVETDDIYHEVGKIICTSIEKIEEIRYTKPNATKEACEELWEKSGYEKISDNFWRLEKPPKVGG